MKIKYFIIICILFFLSQIGSSLDGIDYYEHLIQIEFEDDIKITEIINYTIMKNYTIYKLKKLYSRYYMGIIILNDYNVYEFEKIYSNDVIIKYYSFIRINDNRIDKELIT